MPCFCPGLREDVGEGFASLPRPSSGIPDATVGSPVSRTLTRSVSKYPPFDPRYPGRTVRNYSTRHPHATMRRDGLLDCAGLWSVLCRGNGGGPWEETGTNLTAPMASTGPLFRRMGESVCGMGINCERRVTPPILNTC